MDCSTRVTPTSTDVNILFTSLEAATAKLSSELSSLPNTIIDSRLSDIFRLFQNCMLAIEESKNPIAKAKNTPILEAFQATYKDAALLLRNKSYAFIRLAFGEYPSASNERLKEVEKGWAPDSSQAGAMASILRASRK